MKKAFLLLSILFLLLFSCKKEPQAGNNYFGLPFTLKPGESVSIRPALQDNGPSDSILSVEFIRVIYDSRCPEASCFLCYGSSANIELLLENRKDTAAIVVSVPGCSNELSCDELLYYRTDTLGYRICLLRLDPYPDGVRQAGQSEYSAKLEISKL